MARTPLLRSRCKSIELDCDFYTASCHKWLSGPSAPAFSMSHPRQQPHVRPPVLSWGRLPPDKIESWADEFTWSGTRNPVAYLARSRRHRFPRTSRSGRLPRPHALARPICPPPTVETTQLEPLVPDDPAWYGSMAHVPLSPTTTNETCAVSNPLQHTIWQQARHRSADRRFPRLSLYPCLVPSL